MFRKFGDTELTTRVPLVIAVPWLQATHGQRTPVPLFVNQWSVVHGVRAAQGRYQFMEDVAATLQKFDLGWSWWVWAGGGGATWAHGSSEFLYRFLNGTKMLDRGALEAVRNHMSDSDRYG